ncbi:zinc knuckle CX2CX4HX4C containing protein [Tanacetum coccineum]
MVNIDSFNLDALWKRMAHMKNQDFGNESRHNQFVNEAGRAGVYSVSDILDFNPSLIRVVFYFFKVSLLTPVDIDKFIRDLNSDRIESLLSDDNDSTSEKPSDPIVQSVDINPTPEPSTNDSEVFGVPLNTMKDYETFNTTLTSVEGVAEFFGVPLKTQFDFENFANGIEMGLGVAEKPVSPSDPIVKSVDIHEKPSSSVGEAGASAKNQPKVNSNFRPLVADPVFDAKENAFQLLNTIARNNWAKHGLKRIMMNTKGFFFFKFDSWAGLEAVLEGGPWLIRKCPIILKKWSSFARCLIEVNSEADLVDVVTIGVPSLTGDDFTKETIRVEYEWRPPRCDVCKIFGHLHDHCPKKEASPPIVSTSNVVTPTVVKTNDGFQTVGKKKKRKGKSKSTNGAQFAGPSVKQNIRYEPKAATSVPKKGATNVGNPSNITSPNSFSALNVEVGEEEEEEEEAVENVYDETANIFPNTKTGGSSSFTVAAG